MSVAITKTSKETRSFYDSSVALRPVSCEWFEMVTAAV